MHFKSFIPFVLYLQDTVVVPDAGYTLVRLIKQSFKNTVPCTEPCKATFTYNYCKSVCYVPCCRNYCSFLLEPINIFSVKNIYVATFKYKSTKMYFSLSVNQTYVGA
jgi:hypothetical protein